MQDTLERGMTQMSPRGRGAFLFAVFLLGVISYLAQGMAWVKMNPHYGIFNLQIIAPALVICGGLVMLAQALCLLLTGEEEFPKPLKIFDCLVADTFFFFLIAGTKSGWIELPNMASFPFLPYIAGAIATIASVVAIAREKEDTPQSKGSTHIITTRK